VIGDTFDTRGMIRFALGATLALGLVSGCGSGGSSSPTTPTPTPTPTTPTGPAGAFTATVAFAPNPAGLSSGSQGFLGAWGWTDDIVVTVSATNETGGLISSFGTGLIFAGNVESGNNYITCPGETVFGARIEGNTVNTFMCSLFAEDLEHIARAGQTLRWVLQIIDDSANFVTLEGSLPTPGEPAPPCTPGPETACLLSDRFEVSVIWSDGTDPFDGRVLASANDEVLFSFADPTTPSVTVRMTNACATASRYRTTLIPASSLEYEVAILDTRTGAAVAYRNPPGENPGTQTDDNAFGTCP